MKNAAHCINAKNLFSSLCLISLQTFAQVQVYDDFEGNKVVRYHEKGGVLDTVVKNPSPNTVNNSPTCALYIRNSTRKFDNVKMGLSTGLTDVDKFATYLGIPPKFKLKIYTTAPAGTLVEILLGSRKGNNDYPAGTHSQYQAYTKKSNEWEELEFLFSQIPQGSETSMQQIDQVVLLFNPNSATSDTYYFDDLSGPPLGAAVKTDRKSKAIPESVNTTKPEIAPPADSKEQQPKKTKKTKAPTAK